jgi:hypothetical protein
MFLFQEARIVMPKKSSTVPIGVEDIGNNKYRLIGMMGDVKVAVIADSKNNTAEYKDPKTGRQKKIEYETSDALFKALEKDFGVSLQVIDWLRQQAKKTTSTDIIDNPTADAQTKVTNERTNKNQSEQEDKAVKIVDDMAKKRDDFFT